MPVPCRTKELGEELCVVFVVMFDGIIFRNLKNDNLSCQKSRRNLMVAPCVGWMSPPEKPNMPGGTERNILFRSVHIMHRTVVVYYSLLKV